MKDMKIGSMKVIDYIWVSGGATGTIGFVLCRDEITNEIKCYAGMCGNAFQSLYDEKGNLLKSSEMYVIEHIVEWGGKVPLKMVESMFPEYQTVGMND